MTIGWMMVAVAVVAVFLGGVDWHRRAMARREMCLKIALAHDLDRAYYLEGRVLCSQPDLRKAAYHEAMMRKYFDAYDFPWFPVPPDPPEP